MNLLRKSGYFAAIAIFCFEICGARNSHAQCQWYDLTKALPTGGGLSLAVNPRNHNTIFSGGFALLASYDRGKTWRNMPIPSEVRDLRIIVFHPQDTTIMFIGGFNDGVWKTNNAGMSWRKVLANVNFDGISLVVDPQHPDTLHVGSFNPTGLHTSYDRGETWFVASDTLTGFCSLAIHPDSANVLLGGTTRGTVSKSRDYGRTWRVVTRRQASEVPRVIFDPFNPNFVYGSVVVPMGDNGFIRSTDAGETWEGSGLFNISTWALTVSATQRGVIYLGGFYPSQGKVFASKDHGENWQVEFEGLPANGDAWMLERDASREESVYLAMFSNIPARGAVYKLIGEKSPPLPPENLTAQEPGTGTNMLLRWEAASVCSAAVQNYRVFYGKKQEGYTDSLNVGSDTTCFISDLQEGNEYSASVIAVDIADRRSDFAAPIQFIPRSLPGAPASLHFKRRFHATELSWPANHELDIAGYHVYRKSDLEEHFMKLNVAPVNTLVYMDENLPENRFSYFVTAKDNTQNESAASPIVTLRPITLSRGILVVDESRDGEGSLASPSDEQIDDYYRLVLQDFAFAEYDVLRSGVPDDSLGAFSTIIWHADALASGELAGVASFLADYLDAGGKLWLSGWNIMRAFVGSAGFKAFAGGDFVHQYLHVDTTWISGSPAFEAAASALPQYGNVNVDSAKVPVSAWHGRLSVICVFAPRPGAETIYTFSAADPHYQFHGRPVGIKFTSDRHKVVLLGFPLYFMQEDQSRAAAHVILTQDFGESPLAVSEGDTKGAVPQGFALLQNSPNPFNSATKIHFTLPQAGRVQIEVFDLLGRFITEAVNDQFRPGKHALVMRPQLENSGVYFYRLTVRQEERIVYRRTRKLLYMP